MPHVACSVMRQIHGQRFAADAHAGDRQLFSRRIVQADAAEIDRQVVFQRADDHLEDAAQILAFADGARDLVQQIETFQLHLEFLLGFPVLRNLAFQSLHGLCEILGSALEPGGPSRRWPGAALLGLCVENLPSR